jgi:hypothetical protein
MSSPKYAILRWKHGWSVESHDGAGVSLADFSEILKVIGTKDNTIDPVLGQHLQISGYPRTICVAGNPSELQIWRKQVTQKS